MTAPIVGVDSKTGVALAADINKSENIPFHFIMPVWGRRYTQLFLEISLPSQLGAGNLSAFSEDRLTEYKIYTTSQDAEVMRSSNIFLQLQSLMPVSMIVLDDLKSQSANQNLAANKLAVKSMARCHRMAIEEGSQEDAALIFLHPDMVWSSGSFAQLRARAYDGKRVVAIAPLRAAIESFLPQYRSRFGSDEATVSASARDLIRLALSHLHPIISAGFIGSGFEPLWYLLWSVGGDGFIYRGLTMHPLLIRPTVHNVDFKISFDEDYCYLAVPDYNSYHVVTDSDEILAFELSPKEKLTDMLIPGNFDPFTFGKSVIKTTNSIRRKILLNKIRVHANTMDDEWFFVEQSSDEAIGKAFTACAISEEEEENCSSDFRSFDDVKKVVIFGAGSGGDQAYDLATAKGWETQFFVDSNAGLESKQKRSLMVEAPERLLRRDFDLIIVASAPGYKAIFDKLEKMGFLMSAGEYLFFRDPVLLR